jgi:hypothetical protein
MSSPVNRQPLTDDVRGRCAGHAQHADQVHLVAVIGVADGARREAEVGELDSGCAVDHQRVPVPAVAEALLDDPGREAALTGEREV